VAKSRAPSTKGEQIAPPAVSIGSLLFHLVPEPPHAPTPERPDVSYDLRATAGAACETRGAQHGTVRIIDSEQRRDGRVTVWGTVQDAQQRRSFECTYDRRVIAFKLRPIQTR
jgi:hypothetical protein